MLWTGVAILATGLMLTACEMSGGGGGYGYVPAAIPMDYGWESWRRYDRKRDDHKHHDHKHRDHKAHDHKPHEHKSKEHHRHHGDGGHKHKDKKK